MQLYGTNVKRKVDDGLKSRNPNQDSLKSFQKLMSPTVATQRNMSAVIETR